MMSNDKWTSSAVEILQNLKSLRDGETHNARAPRGVLVSAKAAAMYVDAGIPEEILDVQYFPQPGKVCGSIQLVMTDENLEAYEQIFENLIRAFAKTEENQIGIRKFFHNYTKNPERLIKLRQAADLTQHELAELSGIRQPHYAAMESGKRPISEKSSERIREALNFYLRPPTEEERQESRRRAREAVNAVFARHDE